MKNQSSDIQGQHMDMQSQAVLGQSSDTHKWHTSLWAECDNNIKHTRPLIHCITSPIASNDCANAVLALGGRPIMAENPREVEEIVVTAQALSVSLANINDVRTEAIMRAGKAALEKGIPSVIDAVGVSCSSIRREAAWEFIKMCRPAVIKGNVSEVRTLMDSDYISAGVDTSEADRELIHSRDGIERLGGRIKEFAAQNGCTVMATGETDIISDGKTILYAGNGKQAMSYVTGTGCILSCLVALYLSELGGMCACAAAVSVLGICGELADDSKGLGTYHVGLIDAMSTLDVKLFEQRARVSEHADLADVRRIDQYENNRKTFV